MSDGFKEPLLAASFCALRYQMRKVSLLLCAWSMLLLAGCDWFKGPMGPEGPAGSTGSPAPNTDPHYYYSNDFDTAANVNEWMIYKSGGLSELTASLDTTVFHSPSTCLKISTTASVGGVSGSSCVYIPIPINTSKELWVECDWYFPNPIGNQELCFNQSTNSRMTIGYSDSSSSVYLVQNSTQVNVVSSPSLTQWHHVKMVYNPVNNKSKYWFDSLLVGEGYTTNQSHTLYGPSTGYFSIKAPIGWVANFITRVDNVRCYYY